jgi:hypothetical protein
VAMDMAKKEKEEEEREGKERDMPKKESRNK